MSFRGGWTSFPIAAIGQCICGFLGVHLVCMPSLLEVDVNKIIRLCFITTKAYYSIIVTIYGSCIYV